MNRAWSLGLGILSLIRGGRQVGSQCHVCGLIATAPTIRKGFYFTSVLCHELFNVGSLCYSQSFAWWLCVYFIDGKLRLREIHGKTGMWIQICLSTTFSAYHVSNVFLCTHGTHGFLFIFNQEKAGLLFWKTHQRLGKGCRFLLHKVMHLWGQRGKGRESLRLSLAGEALVSPAAAVYAGGASCTSVATSVLLRELTGE